MSTQSVPEFWVSLGNTDAKGTQNRRKAFQNAKPCDTSLTDIETSLETSVETSMESKLTCRLSDLCSGCDRIDLNRFELEEDRRQELARMGFSEVPTEFSWVGTGGLRDRLEFTLTESSFGLFSKKSLEQNPSSNRSVVDIDTCPQLSRRLQDWLTEFRKDLPRRPKENQTRGSIRLRIAPDGTRGCWLDFSNEDVRDLLNDGDWFDRQLARGVVIEVGQKRKRLVRSDTPPRKHRLIDPVLAPWFETLSLDAAGMPKTSPLFGAIGTFTQPGFQAQAVLVKTVLSHLERLFGIEEISKCHIAEFGCGAGAFTIPLLSTGATVDVFEFDRLALQALEKAVDAAGLTKQNLRIFAGDFIQSARAFESVKASRLYDVVVVDPPRPGLGKFLETIGESAPKAHWLYVSCFPESFARDTEALKARGLKLEAITIVEQFPFTHHFEIVATFRSRLHIP